MRIRTWVEAFEGKYGEKLETLYIAKFCDWSDEESYQEGWIKEGPLPISEITQLDKEFDDGYGGEDNPPMTGWSENYVFASSCYDGSTTWFALPRNPSAEATMPGGG